MIEHLPTREGYDRWSEIYDDENNPLIVLEERHLPNLLGDVRGLEVVDLGCGTGRHAVRLSAAGARVTAVDFSEGMVAKARSKPGWESVRFVAHDLTQRLPFADRSFPSCARLPRARSHRRPGGVPVGVSARVSS